MTVVFENESAQSENIILIPGILRFKYQILDLGVRGAQHLLIFLEQKPCFSACYVLVMERLGA
jgi:hypothetical protein